jgi:hypothetical protein
MNRAANRMFANYEPQVEQAGRHAAAHMPMGTAGGPSDRTLAGMQNAAMAAKANLYGQLETAAPGINQEANKINLMYKQAESADDLGRRALTVGHQGNLMSMYGNIYGRAQNWAPQMMSTLAGMVQPLPFSYSGIGGQAGKDQLFEAGLHPNQNQLVASGYQPSGENPFQVPDSWPWFNPPGRLGGPGEMG